MGYIWAICWPSMGPEVLKIIENDRKTWKKLKTNEVKKAIMGSRVLKIIENHMPYNTLWGPGFENQ